MGIDPDRSDAVETPEELTAEEGVVSDETAFSSPEQRQRAGAAAAYKAAQHKAPPKLDESEQPIAALDPEALAQQRLEELAAKAEKADEYLLLAQRTQADFENYRKRAARDAALAQDRGVAKLAKELLPAIDNLDRALMAAEAYVAAAAEIGTGDAAAVDGSGATPGDSQFVDGLKLVHAEMLAALARTGIEPFSPVGEPFDPQHHEAVAQHQVPGQAPGTVIEVYQQGFRHGDTVLRPARVLVAS
jgi:molecular chaperone GrpE